MAERVVMWRNLDEPGAEVVRIGEAPTGPAFTGTVLIALPEPYEVRYSIRCDREWRTREVRVHLVGSGASATLTLETTGNGRWLARRVASDGDVERVLDLGSDVIDVDLGVSPVTNTLPIRRLQLAVGEAASIAVAWLQFPSLEVVRSVQRYERLDTHVYRFSDDTFEADLVVDDDGVVVTYPTGWERVSEEAARDTTAAGVDPRSTR